MSKILIKGTNVYDGAWEFDPGYFTNGEFHRIKQISDVRAGELSAALAAGDIGVIVALAAVALERHGKQVDVDILWNATDVPEMEDEAEPEADVLPPVSAGGESSGPDVKSSSSAPVSANGSENQETIPAATGAGSSASSASAPAISPTSPPTS